MTEGGDADVAYRIARCLQARYERVYALIAGYCKSAGTLVAVGAHELIFSAHGELGPLDVQLPKVDDLWSQSSGLTVEQAFASLQTKALQMFEDIALFIKVRSSGQVTFKTAADIATKLTTGLMAPIYQQIEVMHVGESGRAMNIAKEYGERLNAKSRNLKPDALERLLAAYPYHGFVIDMVEAKTLFTNVREVSSKEQLLCDAIGDYARYPSERDAPLYYISDPPTREGKPDESHQARRDSAGEKPRVDAAADGATEKSSSPAAEGAAEVVKFPGTAH